MVKYLKNEAHETKLQAPFMQMPMSLYCNRARPPNCTTIY